MVKSIGEAFEAVVEHNFDVDALKRRTVSERAAVEEQLHVLRDDADRILVVPDKSIFTYRAMLEFEDRQLAVEHDTTLSKSAKTTQLVELDQIIERHAMRTYMAAYDLYERAAQAKNTATSDIRKLDAQKERLTALELVLKAFCDAMRVMVQKIKLALNKFRAVADQLKSTIIVRATGVSVVNPWDANNLPGMLEILFDRYLKKTFVGFTNSLIEAMSWTMSAQDSVSSPMTGVQQVQKLYSTWERKGMWEELTKDQFWTAILIRGIHPSAPLRLQLLTELTKYMKTLDVASVGGDAMPIFSFITEMIQQDQTNKRFAQLDMSGAPASNPRSPWGYGKRAAGGGGRDNSESAAVAGEEKLLSGEVFATHNVTYFDSRNKKTFPYIAVRKMSSVCDKCFPDTGAAQPCSPPCYQVQCRKCSYFGHRQNYCRQATSVSGDDLSL
jgi:Cu/Ag efflux protein CusF